MGFSRQEYWSGVPLPSLQKIVRHFQKFKHRIWPLGVQRNENIHPHKNLYRNYIDALLVTAKRWKLSSSSSREGTSTECHTHTSQCYLAIVLYCMCGRSGMSWLFATPWTVAWQAPLSMVFFRQEYWSGLSSPSPGDLPNSGIEPRSPALQVDSLASEPPGDLAIKGNKNLLQHGWTWKTSH